MIILGLGTGRSGTASLAKLLNAQTASFCFHEMDPACVRNSGTLRPILNSVDEFQAIIDGGDPGMLTVDLSRAVSAAAYDVLKDMPSVRMIGDIAHYYLSYVRDIARHNADVRFICLRRDKTQTVRSWQTKTSIQRWRSKKIADYLGSLITREPYFTARNPWMTHDGTKWAADPVWDKCFPKFEGPTRKEAIEQYWDYYNRETTALEAEFPDIFQIVPTETLNTREGQDSVLSMCGIAEPDRVYVDAHIHQSARNAAVT